RPRASVQLSVQRRQAALFDLLQGHYRQGHCAYPEDHLLQEAAENLSLPMALIEEALELEILQESLVADNIGDQPCIYLKEVWDLEKKVAQNLLSFPKK